MNTFTILNLLTPNSKIGHIGVKSPRIYLSASASSWPLTSNTDQNTTQTSDYCTIASQTHTRLSILRPPTSSPLLSKSPYGLHPKHRPIGSTLPNVCEASASRLQRTSHSVSSFDCRTDIIPTPLHPSTIPIPSACHPRYLRENKCCNYIGLLG